MTNKEAIIWLRGIRDQFTGNCTTDTLVPISRCDIRAIDLAIKALEERPQGEWIIVKDEKYGDNVKCPFCSKELAGTDLNFCCKCGAKLIGSEKTNGSTEE